MTLRTRPAADRGELAGALQEGVRGRARWLSVSASRSDRSKGRRNTRGGRAAFKQEKASRPPLVRSLALIA